MKDKLNYNYFVDLDRDTYPLYQDIWRWTMNQFGDDIDRWDYSITFGYQQYWFRDEADAILFTLMWVGNET
jgi:hypothetical protein